MAVAKKRPNTRSTTAAQAQAQAQAQATTEPIETTPNTSPKKRTTTTTPNSRSPKTKAVPSAELTEERRLAWDESLRTKAEEELLSEQEEGELQWRIHHDAICDTVVGFGFTVLVIAGVCGLVWSLFGRVQRGRGVTPSSDDQPVDPWKDIDLAICSIHRNRLRQGDDSPTFFDTANVAYSQADLDPEALLPWRCHDTHIWLDSDSNKDHNKGDGTTRHSSSKDNSRDESKSKRKTSGPSPKLCQARLLQAATRISQAPDDADFHGELGESRVLGLMQLYSVLLDDVKRKRYLSEFLPLGEEEKKEFCEKVCGGECGLRGMRGKVS